VSYIETNSAESAEDFGQVQLQAWDSPRPSLTVEQTITNYGHLDVEDLRVAGSIVNRGVLDFDNVEVLGNVWNQAGADLGLDGDQLDIECGDLTNDGDVLLTPNDELWVERQIINRGSIEIYLAQLSSDGLLTNHAAGSITGTGGGHYDDGVVNFGMIRSEGGDLIIHAEGCVTNEGTLATTPGTSLHVMVEAVDQRGQIVVNAQGAVTFTCDLTNSPGASIELLSGTIAAPNVVNEPNASFTGFGGVTGDLTNNGLIELYGDSFVVGDVRNAEGAELKIRNGELLVTGHTTNDGRIKVTNGDAYFEGGLTDNGRLEIDPALVVVVGDLDVGSDGVMTLDANSTLQLMGNFENRSTRKGDFDLSQGTVQFHGEGTQDFEAAGRDVGTDPSGWVENFAIGRLMIEPDSLVRLADLCDNQLDGNDNEAVYVDELLIETGGWIDPNGLSLYYRNGGDPKRLFYGDFDFSGDVGRSDFAILEAGFGTAAGAGWADGDTDGDGDVDFRDYLTWKANVGLSSGAAPEPATLALLALPAGAVLLRRRRR